MKAEVEMDEEYIERSKKQEKEEEEAERKEAKKKRQRRGTLKKKQDEFRVRSCNRLLSINEPRMKIRESEKREKQE